MGFSPAGGTISGADDVAISNAADNQVLTYDSGTQLWRNENSSGGSGGSIGTEVLFSSLTGANDDAKLASFMTTQSGATYKGKTLVLDESRNYTFTQQRTLYSGFSIRGAFRPQDQARGGLPIGNEVTINISGGGGWFTMPASGNVFSVSMTNMSIDGNSGSYLLEQGGGSAVLWTSVFRDIAMQNCGGVLGTSSEKLLTTAICLDGWWNVNNVRDQAFNIGGSDCFITPTMFLLDSPTSLLAANKYLMGFESQSKTTVQNFYITAEEHSAITITGSSADRIRMHDMTIEGRNAGAPCVGALIRSSGQFSLRDSWTSYAMSNPAANGRGDEGVMHITGGRALIDGCDYERATGVAESVPYIYVTGASTRVVVRNITGIGSWSGKPIVRQTQSGLVDADSSVTVITG